MVTGCYRDVRLPCPCYRAAALMRKHQAYSDVQNGSLVWSARNGDQTPFRATAALHERRADDFQRPLLDFHRRPLTMMVSQSVVGIYNVRRRASCRPSNYAGAHMRVRIRKPASLPSYSCHSAVGGNGVSGAPFIICITQHCSSVGGLVQSPRPMNGDTGEAEGI